MRRLFISSDTNIWVDFLLTDAIELPFRLPHHFCMSSYAIEDELIQPRGIAQRLMKYGLHATEITEEEYDFALSVIDSDYKLSVYDCFALAIAKMRGYILLTGDGRLRKRAQREGVEVHGTLWIFDQLKEQNLISVESYQEYMRELLHKTLTNAGVRLPKDELEKRLKEK